MNLDVTVFLIIVVFLVLLYLMYLRDREEETHLVLDNLGQTWYVQGEGTEGLTAHGWVPCSNSQTFTNEEALEKFPSLRPLIQKKIAMKMAEEELESC